MRLDAGWRLHEIFFGVDGDYRPYYILLCLDEVRCPKCDSSANVEVVETGERLRYICTRECS